MYCHQVRPCLDTVELQCNCRPGASGAAAALAVELAMSCLAHSLASGAPAPGRSKDEPVLESVVLHWQVWVWG